MMLRFKNLLQLTATFSLSLFLFACQAQPDPAELAASTPQWEKSQEPGEFCRHTVGTTLQFDLFITHNPAETDFSTENNVIGQVDLGTVPPFRVGKDCMCELTQYGLVFSSEPHPAELVLYDANGNEIAWSGPFLANNGTDWVVFVNAANLQQNIFVSFNPLTDPLPELVRAGGLCMIDNVALPIETHERTTAYETYKFDPDGQPLEPVIYVGDNHGVPVSQPSF